MKRNKLDRKLNGPDTYEYFNNLSKYCHSKYLSSIALQLIFLVLIAIFSILPASVMLHISLLILLIIVLILMILQYKDNFIEGWQKSRFLAESILSNFWLAFFRIDFYDNDYEITLSKLHEKIGNLKLEIDVSNYYSLQKREIKDNDNPDWLVNNYNNTIDIKKQFYIENRLDDQINWYNIKSEKNRKSSIRNYRLGIAIMGLGSILTILSIVKIIPNLSYLGLFTTLSASIFSWKQTRKYDELKITYSVTLDELIDLKNKICTASTENEIKDLICNIENAISREHKLWYSKINFTR